MLKNALILKHFFLYFIRKIIFKLNFYYYDNNIIITVKSIFIYSINIGAIGRYISRYKCI